MSQEAKAIEEYIENEFKEINRLSGRGHLIKARKRCELLFELYPQHQRVIHGIGLLRYRTGDHDNGEQLLRQAILINPDFCDAHKNLGQILYSTLRLDEAEVHIRKAVDLSPNGYETIISLAEVLVKRGKYREAFDYCQRALLLNSNYAPTFLTLGSVMLFYGKTNKAIDYLKQGMKLEKHCLIHSVYLFALNLLPNVSQQEIFLESVAWGQKYADRLLQNARGYFNNREPGRRINIGYVSGDMRLHPVGYHLRPVLASHDKTSVKVFLYNSFPLCDEMTETFAGYADCYRDISRVSDEKAETLIRRDCIDILIDLSGHTAFSRLFLFARRPAPIQVSWLGYFNTTGMTAIDYLISDEVTIPREEDQYFVEKVIRLPDGRFCYEPQPYSPNVATLPAARNTHITFGSFNAVQKISDEVIALWSRVLLATPDSRMILKSKSFEDDEVKDDFIHKFSLYGIPSERLDLRGKTPHAEMLAEYGDVDISLDTFPYNGGATTCEALWMGVPVVTLAGGTPISRQSKSFLHTIGYPEWVAETSDEFVKIATDLAADFSRLSLIRLGLRQKMAESPLCNGRRFTGNLEHAYRRMWEKWCETNENLEVAKYNTRRFGIDELIDAGLNSLDHGEYQQAVDLFNCVLKRKPGHAPAYNNLGVALKKMGRIAESIRAFRNAIRNEPAYIDVYINLGCTYLDHGYFKQARDLMQRALTLAPDNCEALISLGTSEKYLGHLGSARKAFERVLTIDSINVDALGHLALLNGLYGDVTNALRLLKIASKANPDNEHIVSALMGLSQYHPDTMQHDIYKLGRRFEEILSKKIVSIYGFQRLSQNKNHLNIGFVSADFRCHPVGMLLIPLFKDYDRSRLSLFCYNKSASRPDTLSMCFQSVACGWRDIWGIDEDASAQLIQADCIDILIDLSGHTDATNQCLPLFVKHPAPVQASWLGYGHTTGLSAIDYIIADREFIRPQDSKWFAEKAVYLPHNRFCFTPPIPYPEVVEAPVTANGYITFGSFNNPEKYSEEVISLWARLMRAIPRSRLILKYKSLSDPSVRRHLRQRFEKYGISARRIELRPASGYYLMMAEFGDIDISLDPFPFTGGMTSLFSLWMGVPIVTLTGDLPINRQTKSFLGFVGLDDLVANNYDEYISIAISLSSDYERLCTIREALRNRMSSSPLCDTKEYVASVEHLFFRMWQDKCECIGKEQHQNG